ncbi:hypothetical protein L6R52_43240, partial [Myxococcota bacterium]|nr:hypothetical protein [Myxococcota bacterium]
DNAVSVFDLERGLEGSMGVRLPETEDRCGRHVANPWFAAPLDDTRVAVTAFGQGRVYVVELDHASIEHTLELAADVALEPPFTLPRAVDLDCDGVPESTVSRVRPRAPQGVAKVGARLVVAFSGFVEPRVGASAPVYVPSVLAIWDLDALDAPPSQHVLPALNAQEVRALDDHRVLVTMSGVLDPIGGAVAASTPGAVTIFDVEAASVERTWALDGFAPGTALVAADALWVGSLVHGAVRAIALDTGAVLTELTLSSDDVDSVMRLVELPGGLVGAPSFNGDRLFVVDPVRRVLSPPPFFGPLVIGPGRPIFDGLQVVARRPGTSGVDFCGPELFALSGLASRVVPIELRRILGP